MTRSFDLVMFDLDGTLVETAPEISDAVNDTLKRFDLSAVDESLVKDWIGHGTKELLAQAVAHASSQALSYVKKSDAFLLMLAEFDTHYQRRCGTRSRLYPQVRETLNMLREQGVKLAVVTNKEGAYTATVLNAHELIPLLDYVVSGDTFSTKKPDPVGIHSCLKKFGIAADRALFVGDSSIDVATARNAGVKVWALPYGYNMGQSIEVSSPDRVIADCSALI
jgi:phosphoglycolate phosphatase